MSQELFAWGPAAIWAAVLFLLSAQDGLPGAGWLAPVLAIPGMDKVVHFVLYAVLGGALAHGRHYTRSAAGRLPHAVLLAAGVLYGASDEWHQSFVPGRMPSLADLAVDALGVCAGYALGRAYGRSRTRTSVPSRPHDPEPLEE